MGAGGYPSWGWLPHFKVGGDSGQRRLSFLLEVWAWRDEV